MTNWGGWEGAQSWVVRIEDEDDDEDENELRSSARLRKPITSHGRIAPIGRYGILRVRPP